MKAYIGVGEMQVRVKVIMDLGEVVVIEVRDVATNQNLQPYLEQTTLERLAQDWMLDNESTAEVCF